MIAGEYDWEFIALECGLYDVCCALKNRKNALNSFRIDTSSRFKEELVLDRNFYCFDFAEEVAPVIERCNFNGIRTKTGSASTCSYLRFYFDELYFFHPLLFRSIISLILP